MPLSFFIAVALESKLSTLHQRKMPLIGAFWLILGGDWGLWTITTKLLYIKYFAFQFLFGNPLRNQAAKRRAWLSSLSFLRFHKDNEPKNISKRFSFFFNIELSLSILDIKVCDRFVAFCRLVHSKRDDTIRFRRDFCAF